MLTHERWEDSYVIMSHTCRKIKKSLWQNSQKLVIHCMNHNLPKLCPQLFPIVKAKVCLYDQKQNKNSHPFVTCYILLEVLIRAIKQEKVTKMSSTTTKKKLANHTIAFNKWQWGNFTTTLRRIKVQFVFHHL